MIMWYAALGITHSCAGLWQYLAERTRGQIAVRLEQERNQATAAVLGALPPGGELLEYEPQGRLRIIRLPGPGALTAVPDTQTMDEALCQPGGGAPK